MIKNLSTNQLLLIAMAAILLLLAAFAFFLLQDPAAPLPFSPVPPTSTATLLPIPTGTLLPPSPTRRTSYTPMAIFLTPLAGTPSEFPTAPGSTSLPQTSPLVTPSASQSSPRPTSPTLVATTVTPRPTVTVNATVSGTPPTVSSTPSSSPTVTGTYSPGEIAVTGRVVQNATPVANVLMTFADDTAPRQARTNSGGHFSFTTLAPGTGFILSFRQSDNPNLTPPTEIASLITVEGTLPTNVNPIDFPDIELSLNFSGIVFEPQSPVDGATYSASIINSSNPIQFVWSLYGPGGSYHAELGPNGSDEPIWTSPLLAGNNYMWDGTLDNGSHITQGAYWWRVSATKSLTNYVEVIYSQTFDILFNP